MHRYGWISECWTKAPPKMFHIVLPQQGPFTWIKGFWQLDILDLLTLHGDHDVPKAWNLVWIFKRFTWTPQNQKGDFFWILPDPNSHCCTACYFWVSVRIFCCSVCGEQNQPEKEHGNLSCDSWSCEVRPLVVIIFTLVLAIVGIMAANLPKNESGRW